MIIVSVIIVVEGKFFRMVRMLIILVGVLKDPSCGGHACCHSEHAPGDRGRGRA